MRDDIINNNTFEDVLSRTLQSISDDTDKRQGSFIYDALAAASIEYALMYMLMADISSKLNIENLEGEELEMFISPRTGQYRVEATKAVGTVIVSGQVGAVINIGDLVSTEEVSYACIETGTIGPSGQVSVQVVCEEYGSVGNTPANTITKFPVNIPGLIDVYNPSEIITGYDEETDEELKSRYYAKLQRPGKAGNKYHYEEWAMEVAGVGGVKVFPRDPGILSVRVLIIDINGLPADPALINNTLDHINNNKPFGADVIVQGPEGVNIDIQVNLTVDPRYGEEDVKDSIIGSVSQYLKEIAFILDYVSYAQIGSIILSTEGVEDYTDLLVNYGTSNILLTNNQVAVMGVIN